MLLNVVIVGTLVGIGFHAPHMGLALASALAGAINAGLLWHWLKRDGVLRVDAAWWLHLRRLLLAGLVLAGWFLWVKLGWADWPAWRGLHRALAMVGILAVGGGLYLGSLWLLGLRPRDVLDRRV
jgi:putative peptidoglycan lipid II flippase